MIARENADDTGARWRGVRKSKTKDLERNEGGGGGKKGLPPPQIPPEALPEARGLYSALHSAECSFGSVDRETSRLSVAYFWITVKSESLSSRPEDNSRQLLSPSERRFE